MEEAWWFKVAKPSRYLGTEVNSIRKPADSEATTIVLAYPEVYEIGASHLGLQILYHLLNAHRGCVAERVYLPGRDAVGVLRTAGRPLCSLESRTPLADFDILGITLPYELCYTNILCLLDLAGLPRRAAERSEEHPVVLGGGACACNPEPMAEFFDAILLGDGEEALPEICRAVGEARRQGVARPELLARLARIQGVYVPSFFQPVYDDGGALRGVEPLGAGEPRVRRRVLADLDGAYFPTKQLVPFIKPVHDRASLEIARGCTRGCRFCQAGMITRPVRERAVETLVRQARECLAATGYEDLSLLSLSAGDYSRIDELVPLVMDSCARVRAALSLPSLRVGTLTEGLMDQVLRERKTGFTIAPEAGSARLRAVINKDVDDEEVIETARAAFARGWNSLKLYFMIGLPGEEREDLEAIVRLVRRVRGEAGGKRVTASFSTFVPKPHTPFQWVAMISREDMERRLGHLKRALRGRGLNIKWQTPGQSVLEGVFSRGDRRLGRLVEEAYRRGALFDGWSESFDLGLWSDAAREVGVDFETYLQVREPGEPLPWDHLDYGVTAAFLRREWERAQGGLYTPDCRAAECCGCGACADQGAGLAAAGSKRPGVEAEAGGPENAGGRPRPGRAAEKAGAGQGAPHRYLGVYEKTGVARALSHLELVSVFLRGLRRAGLPLAYSQGFRPKPLVAFGPALPTGAESLCEYFELATEAALPLPDALANINEHMPPGVTIKRLRPRARYGKSLVGTLAHSTYRADLRPWLNAGEVGWHDLARLARAAERSDSLVVTRRRPRGDDTLNVRPFIDDIRFTPDGAFQFSMMHRPRRSAKPHEVLEAVFGVGRERAMSVAVMKVEASLAAEAAAPRGERQWNRK